MLYDKKWDKRVEAPAPQELWRQQLLDAAQYIRDHGWCQNSLKNPSGEVCALGAMVEVVGGTILGEPFDKLKAALRKLGYPNIADWNNAFGRTKEEVIAVMEQTAQLP